MARDVQAFERRDNRTCGLDSLSAPSRNRTLTPPVSGASAVEVSPPRHDGQNTLRVSRNDMSSPWLKNILLPKAENYGLPNQSRTSQEGRFAIVTTRWRGMRWTLWRGRRMHQSVRSSRVVLSPRRWVQVSGDDPLTTEANKPDTPGRSRSSRKTIAQGVPE